MITEGVLFDQLPENRARCNVCEHRCVRSEGKIGFCGTRKNIDGKIYSLIYNTVSSEAVDPIEKKPLYHFLPGTLSYSLGSIGCNFRCEHCQNWNISQVTLEEAHTREITPEEAVRRAKAAGCKSISWTYNEPAIWHEYTYDSAVLAKEAGLKTVYVTNGYITPEALKRMAPVLDAYRVDIKSFSESFYKEVCSAKLAPVLASTKLAKELGMHVEVINLIIPGRNDSREEITQLVKWMHDNLGADTPLHFTRFHPMYMMTDALPTPVETLEMAHDIAVKEGMRFVYTGNVPGHKYENTYCPQCGTLLVDRTGFMVSEYNIKDEKCPRCGEEIAMVR